MNDDVIVRRFEPRDRAAVREICCDTADAGEPMESYFPDREVFADLLTRYYTDIAPEMSWVAEQKGVVVGYVFGCFDSDSFTKAMGFRVIPAVFFRALGRGLLWNRKLWRLLKANLGGEKSSFHRSHIQKEYPGHLHINLKKGFRGHGAGQILLGRFLEQATAAKVAGVHAGVSDGNAGGRAFFEKSGFVPLGKENRMRKPDRANVPAFTIVYGKKLVAGA